MKFSAIMALAGVVASKELIRLNTYDPAYLQFTENIIDSSLIDATSD